MEAFYIQRARLASGFIQVRPQAACKECTKEMHKRYYEENREAIVARGAARQRSPQSREKKRRTDREGMTMRRRAKGIESNRRNVRDRPPEKGPFFPNGPVKELLLAELKDRTPGTIAAATGVDERRLYSILHEEHPTVSLQIIDSLVTGLGVPEKLHELAPAPERRVGYYYIPVEES